jgi:cytochrome c-type biogenesis protein CcmE
MDPNRKRRIRLVAALTAAILLAGALVYTSFSDATQAKTPSQVLAAGPGQAYTMTGKVVAGSIRHRGATLLFRVRDRGGAASVLVAYQGIVPDPFRDGREVVIQGRMQGGTFVGQRDTLVTKCPSKYQGVPGGKTL